MNKKLPDWIAIEGAYRAGIESVSAIAKAQGLSEGAIRKRAKAKGWSRDPASTKRQIVRTAMAGGTNDGTSIALRTIEEAAMADIADLERGLRIHRQCLIALEVASEAVVEPREVKVIVEATSLAIASIRNIRGLDEAAGSKDTESDDDARAESIAGRLESRIAETAA